MSLFSVEIIGFVAINLIEEEREREIEIEREREREREGRLVNTLLSNIKSLLEVVYHVRIWKMGHT